MIITLILLTYTKVNLNFWNWNVIQVPDLIYYIWQPQDGKPLHNIHFPSSLHTGAINLVAPCPVGTTYWKKQQQDYSVTICQQWDRGYTPKTTHNTAIYQHEFDEGKLTENWETEKLRNWELRTEKRTSSLFVENKQIHIGFFVVLWKLKCPWS